AEDDSPARGAESQGGLAKRTGDEPQDFLGGPRNDRDHDHGERDGPSDRAVVADDAAHEEGPHEDPDRYRGESRDELRRETDDGPPAPRTELGHENRSRDPDRDRQDACHPR